jgi:hypothetical protein
MGCGTVFKLTPSAGKWKFNVVHTFELTDGANPYTDLLLDSAETLYGTTLNGGSKGLYGLGVAFKLSQSGKSWAETLLHSFDVKDGFRPSALISDVNGNLYGTASEGGIIGCNEQGCGVVFKITPQQRIGRPQQQQRSADLVIEITVATSQLHSLRVFSGTALISQLGTRGAIISSCSIARGCFCSGRQRHCLPWPQGRDCFTCSPKAWREESAEECSPRWTHFSWSVDRGCQLIRRHPQHLLMSFEYFGHVRDSEQVLQTLIQVDELQFALLPSRRQVNAYDRTETGTIHVGDIGQIQHDALAFRDEIPHCGLEHSRTGRCDPSDAMYESFLRSSHCFELQFWNWNWICGHGDLLGWKYQLNDSSTGELPFGAENQPNRA